jgi:hypothetical protein
MQIAGLTSFAPSTGIVNPAQAVILSAHFPPAAQAGSSQASAQNSAQKSAQTAAQAAAQAAAQTAAQAEAQASAQASAQTSSQTGTPASSPTSSQGGSTATAGPGGGGAAKATQAQAAADAAAIAQEMMVAGYSTTVHGTNYTGVVDSSAGVYTGSVFNLAMAKSTGVSVEAVDTALSMRIDELV